MSRVTDLKNPSDTLTDLRNEWLAELNFMVRRVSDPGGRDLSLGVRSSLGFDVWREPSFLSALCAEFVQLALGSEAFMNTAVSTLAGLRRFEEPSGISKIVVAISVQLKSLYGVTIAWKNYSLDNFLHGQSFIDKTTFEEQAARESIRINALIRLQVQLIRVNLLSGASVDWVVNVILTCFNNAMNRKKTVDFFKTGITLYPKAVSFLLSELKTLVQGLEYDPAFINRALDAGVNALTKAAEMLDPENKAIVLSPFVGHKISSNEDLGEAPDLSAFFGRTENLSMDKMLKMSFVLSKLKEKKARVWRHRRFHDKMIANEDGIGASNVLHRSGSPLSQVSSKEDGKRAKSTKFPKAKPLPEPRQAKPFKPAEKTKASVDNSAEMTSLAKFLKNSTLESDPSKAASPEQGPRRLAYRVHHLEQPELRQCYGDFVCERVLTSFVDCKEVFYLLQLRDLTKGTSHLVLVRSALALQHFPEDIAAHLEAQLHNTKLTK